MQQLSQIETRYRHSPCNRIMQGDIFKDVPALVWDVAEDGITVTEIARFENPLKFVIVLSQDCDLEQDYLDRRNPARNEDKYIFSVLVCRAYLSDELRDGIHRKDEQMKMSNLGKAGVFDSQVEKNVHPRYHFLKSATEADNAQGVNLTLLVVDFKHYYSLPINVVCKLYNEKHYVGSLNELFREDLSHRFFAYLSRIGLPEVDRDPAECDEGIKSD